MGKEFFEVIDKKTGNLIAKGTKINEKHYYKGHILPYDMISFDNKFFFKLAKNDTYIVNRINEDCGNKLIQNIPDSYKVCQWLNYDLTSDADVIREYDITELDDECVEVVTLLNKIPGIRTVSSCCGHNKSHFYIDIAFSSILALKIILKYIYKHNDRLELKTSWNIRPSSDEIYFKLQAFKKGEEAYKDIQNFCKYLKMVNYTGA